MLLPRHGVSERDDLRELWWHVGTEVTRVAGADPLPSWGDSAAKEAIVDFVARVNDPASPDFVPEAERIATFDNDGTLWSEKPVYFQLLFAMDRVKTMAPSSRMPAWNLAVPQTFDSGNKWYRWTCNRLSLGR